MSGSLYSAAPLRFLVGITMAWTVARGAALMGWQPSETAEKAEASAQAAPAPLARVNLEDREPATPVLLAAAGAPPPPQASLAMREVRPSRAVLPFALLPAAPPAPGHEETRPIVQEVRAETQALLPAGPAVSRFSGSAWAFVRGGGSLRGIAPDGQIGGGQAGARLLYRFAGLQDFAASARISKAIGGPRQTEAALGLDWKPLRALPIHLMVERRFAIDKGGRNAWMIGAAGGVYAVPVAPGWRLDGYGEAGVVGARSRDVFADGAVRVARQIDLGPGRSLALGAGAWGALQPGAKRLDVGPSAVLRLPVDRKTMAVSLDWRERVAGKARPGSGPAFTAAFDF